MTYIIRSLLFLLGLQVSLTIWLPRGNITSVPLRAHAAAQDAGEEREDEVHSQHGQEEENEGQIQDVLRQQSLVLGNRLLEAADQGADNLLHWEESLSKLFHALNNLRFQLVLVRVGNDVSHLAVARDPIGAPQILNLLIRIVEGLGQHILLRRRNLFVRQLQRGRGCIRDEVFSEHHTPAREIDG